MAQDESRWSVMPDEAPGIDQVDRRLRGLLEQSLGGSGGARNELLAALLPRMVAVTRSALSPGSKADVEDVVQEAMVRLDRALPSFRGESTLHHFATRVAIHTATDFVRRKITRRKYEDAAARFAEQADGGQQEPRIDDSRLSRLRFLLDDLSDVQAETLILTALGHSVQDIANGMNVPIETVRSRLRLARRSIRERIAQDPHLKELFGREP